LPPTVCSQIGERQCMLWHSLGAIQLKAGSRPFLTSFQKNGSSGTSNFAHDPSPPFDVASRSVNQKAGLWLSRYCGVEPGVGTQLCGIASL
jgi:hypothetical protein